ncbi:phosphatidylinositol phosphatase PTPRQ-like isoform X3 [Apostichopus japonicus]|uniref:phosphatidylinositol phosphatase PTPRQ-like isoform X3 n=1 Tax=Stichopus japonicus TaxID=307972 RepID=UPI003AB68B0A
MDPLFLTLIQLCALTSSTGACLFRDASRCPAKSPLVFGGRIQAQDPDDPLWENGRKLFVFQTPPSNTHSHLGSSRRFKVRGSRGVIRIASKSCARSGEGSNVCPVTLPSDLPCLLQGSGACSSDPLSFSNITSSGFHIEWKHFDPLLRARGAISGYIVQIREIGGPFHKVTRGAEDPSYDFDLLTPGTTYEVQLVPISTSPSNDIAPSNIQTVTTLCGVPACPAIYVGETTSRTATVNVRIPPTQDWKCSNITVYFQAEVRGEWMEEEELDPWEREIQIDDLIPCSTFNYRVRLSNYHETVFSNVSTVNTTAEGLSAVQNASAISDAAQTGRLNVSWTPPETSDTACSVSHYNVQYSQIKYKTCSNDVENVSEYSLDVTDIEVTLDDLKDYSDYTVSITAMVSKIGQSGFISGETITITGSTIPNNPIEAPSDILLTGVTYSSLTFTWKPPHDCRKQNGIITSYSYILQTVDGEEVRTGTTDKTYVALGDLESNRKYYFMVSAVNSAGTGPYSEPVWEETRYRMPTCPGKSPLRVGGVLRSTAVAGGSRPWGTGQPIFILPHHLNNAFKRGGGVVKVWFGTAKNCGGSSGPCPGRTTETQAQVPTTCQREEGPDDNFSKCDAACPRFSESTQVFITESPTVSSLFLTWRDWDVTLDRGIGPVTGYILRYGKVGEAQTEIQKGLSLRHLFTNLAINTDYSFEVIGLKGTSTMGGSVCDGSTSFQFIHTTGCGRLDPVQNLTVSNVGGQRMLHVSWSPPDGLCPVRVYNVTYPLLRYKACDYDALWSQIYPPLQTNQTELTLDLYDDFAEYNISVTPFTESIDGTGYLMEGETVSMTGITQENVPLMSPWPVTLIDNSSNYIEIAWENVRCSLLGGTFSKFVYSLVQNGVYINGTTQENHVLIDELDAYTSYIVSISVQTTFGEGPPAELTGTTPESTPLSYNPGVTVLNLTGVTATTIEVSWYSWNKLIGSGNGTVKSYLLWFGEQGTESDPYFMDQNLTYQFQELSPDTDYQFQIEVIGNGKGNGVRGPSSHTQIFRTRCGVPAKPELKLTLHTVTTRSAAFHYTFPEDEDPWKCRDVSVYFEMETDAGEWETVQEMSTNDRIVDKSDLLPCSDNRFRIKVENNIEVTFSNEVYVGTDVERLGKVQSLQVQTLNEDGKLLVTWNPPENIDNCHILGYGVWVDFIGIASCKSNELIYEGSYTVNTTEMILDGLQSYSNYYVSVVPLFNYGGNPAEWLGSIGTTKAVSPTGIVGEVELKENATSERSLTFSWGKELDCEEQLGPNFGYKCVLYEMNGGNPVLAGSRRVSEQQCTFNDLKACGSYICKVKPVNDDNEGNFSSPATGNISAAALGSVRNISALPLYNGDVMVRWLPPDDSANLCPVYGFKLNFTLQRHQACHKCIDREQPPLTSNETFLVMKRMSPFTTYKINIAVDVEGGASDLEPTDIVFTTRFAAPSLAPRVWPVNSKVTKTTLEFRWTPPNCTSLNGIFKQYTIGGNATSGETGISGRKTRSYTLYNLTPCTVYSFTVRFVNTFRRGPMGVAYQKTKDDRPGRGFNLMLEPQDNGDLVAIWRESGENPCEVDSYIINIEPVGKWKCEEIHVIDESDIVVDRNDRSYTFGRSELSLWGGTEYQVSVRAVNTLGESDIDAARKFTRVLPPSSSPMRVFLGETTSTSATLSWRRVSCPHTNGEITGYRYQLSLNGEVVQEETTQSRMVVINDLTPGTNYKFNVQGGTSAGFGPLTDDFFFETTD